MKTLEAIVHQEGWSALEPWHQGDLRDKNWYSLLKYYSGEFFTYQRIWYLVKAIGLQRPNRYIMQLRVRQQDVVRLTKWEWMSWQKALGVPDFLPRKDHLESEMDASCSLKVIKYFHTLYLLSRIRKKWVAWIFTYSCLLDSDFSLQLDILLLKIRCMNYVGKCESIMKNGFTLAVKRNQVSKPELLYIPSWEFPWGLNISFLHEHRVFITPC